MVSANRLYEQPMAVGSKDIGNIEESPRRQPTIFVAQKAKEE
jgi:hypothetical protein